MSETTSSSPKAAPATSAPAAAPSPDKYNKASLRTMLLMAVVALCGCLLVLRAWNLWPFHSSVMSTDNAYVRGAVTTLAPQVSGHVQQVLVQDFAHVKAGDVLVQIDPRSYEAALAQAEAQLASAQAQLANAEQTQAQNRAALMASQANLAATQAETERAQAELQRVEALAGHGAVALNERDRVRAVARQAATQVDKARAAITMDQEKIKATTVNRRALEAQVAMAQAQVQQARINLDNTTITAPVDGQVGEVGVRVGQFVNVGTQLLHVVPPQLWVVANFKETQTAHMQVGQQAVLEVDGLDGAELHGTVQDIAPATGSEFSVLKADNASGNFTKVVQRLPVRIAIDGDQALAQRLRPGMSVIAKVDTAAPQP